MIFSMWMLWAQIFPFVVLIFFEDKDGKINNEMKSTITTFLVCSFVAWLLLNVAFFLTIDKKHIKTFSRKTVPQYTCKLFSTNVEDSVKFRTAFKNRKSNAVQDDVQIFVSNNIERWMAEKPKWFKIEKIPDAFLAVDLFEAEGGSQRRRSSAFMELAGLEANEERIPRAVLSINIRQAKEAWKKLAEEIYELRSKEFDENVTAVERMFGENAELLKPLIKRCPVFAMITTSSASERSKISFGLLVVATVGGVLAL